MKPPILSHKHIYMKVLSQWIYLLFIYFITKRAEVQLIYQQIQILVYKYFT